MVILNEFHDGGGKRYMERILATALAEAIASCRRAGLLRIKSVPNIVVQPPTDSRLVSPGDLSTNIALVLASQAKQPPRQIAQAILQHLQLEEGLIDRVELAGPGFINFYVHPGWWYQTLLKIDEQKSQYGDLDLGGGERVQVEFVSANPTGPLHIGHGRGAVVGDVLANILQKAGYQVEREYYINDAGNQMASLGRSVLARYQQLLGRSVSLPENGYRGEYIRDIARQIIKVENEKLLHQPEAEAVSYCTRFACREILAGIKHDLERFGINFDHWFSEQRLYQQKLVEQAIRILEDKGYVVERDGARWLKSSELGDEKDRVVIRSTGEPTYLASDIAYHQNKYQRGFKRVIDIWGADHHGYVERLKAAVCALGHDPQSLNILLVQLVSLVREGIPVAMSTREGEFTTLAEVLDEVGADAARFFFLTRRCDSQLEFDLELAKKQSAENPVYYVQYAHARICSIMRQAQSNGIAVPSAREVDFSLLALPEELELIKKLAEFPALVSGSALTLEPHRLTFYLTDLASRFHKYYHRQRVITAHKAETAARLVLVNAIKTVLKITLDLLGISAPEQM
jgi:arginyl-tRNA synthetase